METVVTLRYSSCIDHTIIYTLRHSDAHVKKWYQRSALLSMKDRGWNVVSQMLRSSVPRLVPHNATHWCHTMPLTVAVLKFIHYNDTEFYHNFQFQPYPCSSLWADLLRSSFWWKKCFVYSVILLSCLATTILVCSCHIKVLHHSNTMFQMYEKIVSPREGVCLECSGYKVFPTYLHLIPLHYTNINTCCWIHCWTVTVAMLVQAHSTQHINTQCQCHPSAI